MPPDSSDYRAHPPQAWKDVGKIDVLKTMKRMVGMWSDFKKFQDLLPVGRAAPDFRLRDAGGTLRSLSELRGSVVVLEFGALT